MGGQVLPAIWDRCVVLSNARASYCMAICALINGSDHFSSAAESAAFLQDSQLAQHPADTTTPYPYMLCCRHSDWPPWQEDNHVMVHMSWSLAAALRQLPLLRQLQLSNSVFDDVGLAAVSSLTNLQELSVDRLWKTSAAGYAALPTSLTLLELQRMRGLEITGSAADSLAALTQLQHLRLHVVGGLALSALGSLT
jgi:hypothetical protein